MASPKQRLSSPLRFSSPRNKSLRSSIISASDLADEFTAVFISTTAAFKRSVDLQIDEQERSHREALSKSLAEHEAVRESAERARLRVELEIERDRRRREAEEQARAEEARLRELQRQTKEQEAALAREKQLRLERERQEQVKQDKIQQERKQADADTAKRNALERAEAERVVQAQRAAEEKEAQKAKQETVAPVKTPQKEPIQDKVADDEQEVPPEDVTVLLPTGRDRRSLERAKYRALHQKLKEMRKWTLNEAAKANFKNQLGDMRRTIQKSLSIVNAIDKEKNKKPTIDIRMTLEQGSKIPLMISLDGLGLGDGQYPAALLFLLNYFAKYIIHRYVDQCSSDPKAANAYGVLVAQVFANPHFYFNGKSLIDVLWAKYYKVCPVLFGLPASGNLEDQVGLAAGFASITLRDFSRSANPNPAPNRLYWTSVARVLSTPPEQRTAAHYVVLRNMIIHSIDRFIQFFGTAAIAVMRVAFKDWPRGAKKDANVMALEATPAVLEKEYGLIL